MPDFGEVLVEIRDQFDAPLPVRVRPWRVILALCLETYVTLILACFDFRRSTISHWGIPPPTRDFDALQADFRRLTGIHCSEQQMEQACEMFHSEAIRRSVRVNREISLWSRAANIGQFLGSTAFMLFSVAVLMSVWTHPTATPWIVTGWLASQAIVTTICVQNWHRR